MNTAGQDFFDQDFFDNQVVVLCEYPIEKLKWYSSINDDIIDDWKKENSISPEIETIARSMLDTFNARVLAVPIAGESKIKHYFEKVLWLIQSYCENGWKNPLKGINHLDNEQIVVHPGTNRCVAAKFLNCQSLSILININKQQMLLSKIVKGNIINNEKDLRLTLSSKDPILWRTENQEELWIDGKIQPGRYYKDFTYEFLGDDAWPKSWLLNEWSKCVYNFLPLIVYVDKTVDIDAISQESKIMKKFVFNDRETGNQINFEYNFLSVNSFEDINNSESFVYLGNKSNFQRNIFELLFFVSPLYRYSATVDNSIIVYNALSTESKTLTIPNHYVR